jgi:hypothetical protein
MLQFDERIGELELIEYLKSLKIDTMNPTTDDRVLRALRGQKVGSNSKPRIYRWLGGAMASVASLCIAGGLIFTLQTRTHVHQNLTTASNGQQNVSSGPQNVSSTPSKPSLIGPRTTYKYTYTGSEAIPAIKRLIKFKVKEPVVPTGFPPYLVYVNSVPEPGSKELRQWVSFTTGTVPGKTQQFTGKNSTEIIKTHDWQAYEVMEYSKLEADEFFKGLRASGVPHFKTMNVHGVSVNVYTVQHHDHNFYTFWLDGHLVSVRFDAGNYKLAVDPLTDKNAWRIIDSLITGNTYLN